VLVSKSPLRFSIMNKIKQHHNFAGSDIVHGMFVPQRMRQLQTRNRRGAMLPLILVLLPGLLVLAAFAVNLAHVESTNTEIQIACDAAVRAAGRVYSLTGDRDLALQAAREAAEQNPIGNTTVLPIADGDLMVGRSERSSANGRYEFTPTFEGNSIRITTDSLANGEGIAVTPLLPIFGFQTEIRPRRSSISTQSDVDIALVIDRSGSMAYAVDEVALYPPNPAAAPEGWDFGDPVPDSSRWLDLIAAVDVFATTLEESPQQEMVSLTLYNDTRQTVLDLTTEYNLLFDPLSDISEQFDEGGTNVGGGMITGLRSLTDTGLARNDAVKVIVILTDGVHNSGRGPISAARAIAEEGVTVFTITFSDEAPQGVMQRVADICGGRHFHATTGTGLRQAFTDIARHLPNLITK